MFQNINYKEANTTNTSPADHAATGGAGVTRRRFVALAGGLALTALAGCSNGGGGVGPGPSGTTTITGRVLRAETNAPAPNASVTVGGRSTMTAADGTFTLSSVDATIKTATVKAAAPAMARTLSLALTANISNPLGDIFVSDTGYTANTTGTVVAPINGAQQPVGNATVTIAGAQVKTGTDGTFAISNLPIGLGALANVSIGTITAPNFDTRQIYAPFVFEAGANPLGVLLLGTPIGTIPPSLPYTVTGKVTVGGKVPTNAVTVSIAPTGGTTLGGTVTTDSSGSYFFWVVAGTYTVTALNGAAQQTASVTLASLDAPVTAPPIGF